ncbi:hypothetical protein [Anabaena sp. WA102]|jgi:hypothetical protein|uniref:hypothetical protein n=1 Tax=Anabaena sp. WA102 TaxID=1647413 RepID=UPI000A5FE558|nr:hypothetical protein [Anabaena sp. WA102]
MILEEGVRSHRVRSQEEGVRSQESGVRRKKKEEGGKITHNCANIIYCESLH